MASSREKAQNSVALALQKAVAKHQSGDLGAAARAYRAILKRHPRHADALHLLGLTAHQSGDQARAIRHIQAAVALRPQEPLFLSNLGLAQHAAGNLAAAEASFRGALAASGEDLPARLHLGTVLAAQGRDEEALDEFMTLIEGRKPEALWHAKAGQVLRQLGRLEEAEAQFRIAVEISPRDPELLASLASLVHVRGRNDDAIDLYRQVLDIRPDYSEVFINLGNCLVAAGKLEEARTAFADALALDETLEGAITGLVYLNEREGDFDAAWEKLAPEISTGKSAPISASLAAAYATLAGRLDREADATAMAERSLAALTPDQAGGAAEMNLRFALGRLYERTGDFDRAFGHFQAGNALTRQIFDSEKYDSDIDALIEFFDSPEPTPIATNTDETAVFIVGMPRSGTSLVEQILACHPSVHGAGEVPYLFEAIDTIAIGNAMELPFPQRLGLAGPAALEDAAQLYLRRLRQTLPEPLPEPLSVTANMRITDKLPGNILHVGMIQRMLPRARIIHIRRDTMDTCLSCFVQNFGERLPFTANLEHLAVYFAGYDRLGRHWANIMGSLLLEIRYEDLITDTEGQSRRMLEFIDLPWDPEVLNFHTSGRIVSTASYDQVRQPIYRGSMGRWRNYETHLQPLATALKSRQIDVESP